MAYVKNLLESNKDILIVKHSRNALCVDFSMLISAYHSTRKEHGGGTDK